MRTRGLTLAALVALSCTPARSRVAGDTDADAAHHIRHVHYFSASDFSTGDADEADEVAEPAAPAPAAAAQAAPPEVKPLTDADIARMVASDLPALGSLSMGKPNAGAVVNSVAFPEGERWEIIVPQRAYGTQETVDYLQTAIHAVHAQFPGTHKLSIGHLGKERGGPVYPHRSHQSGRDVDIGYYYLPGKEGWYRRAMIGTLDMPRTWALLRALIVHTDPEMIFIDLSVQKILKEYALGIGEDKAWLDTIFQYKSRVQEPLIRHTWGHATHIHVRFYNPRAQALGIRAYEPLVKQRLIKPLSYLVSYRAGDGDTVSSLAQKAGIAPSTLMKVNGIGNVTSGQTLFLPMRGHVAEVKSFAVPPRRLPPFDPSAE